MKKYRDYIELFNTPTFRNWNNEFCAYCGKNCSLEFYHIDHVVPKALGGSNRKENKVMACADCNVKKHKHTIDEWRLNTRLKKRDMGWHLFWDNPETDRDWLLVYSDRKTSTIMRASIQRGDE